MTSVREYQCLQHPAYFVDHFSVGSAFQSRPSDLPIKALHLIGKNYAWRLARNQNLKGIAFDLRRHWAKYAQRRFPIIRLGRKDQRRSMVRLFVAGLGVKVYPNDIATIRNVCHQSTSSAPTAFPVTISRCKFSGDIRASNSSSR